MTKIKIKAKNKYSSGSTNNYGILYFHLEHARYASGEIYYFQKNKWQDDFEQMSSRNLLRISL